MTSTSIRKAVLSISEGYSKALPRVDARYLSSWLLEHGARRVTSTQLLVQGREKLMKFTFVERGSRTHVAAQQVEQPVCTLPELDAAILVKRLTIRRSKRLTI